jgi:hypothetical protein
MYKGRMQPERARNEWVGVKKTAPISQSCPIRVACKINHGTDPFLYSDPPLRTHILHHRMPSSNLEKRFCVYFPFVFWIPHSILVVSFHVLRNKPNQCKWWQNFSLSMSETQMHSDKMDDMSLLTSETVIFQYQSRYHGFWRMPPKTKCFWKPNGIIVWTLLRVWTTIWLKKQTHRKHHRKKRTTVLVFLQFLLQGSMALSLPL